MSIPKLTADLAVIQKLSDLPNSADGLTAEELKARFDQAALDIQKWINEKLVPALKAENIPFTASTEISAENIQDAVANVQAQIRDAATGAIANGSVTKEKLASELLARVFGGRPWVSMNEPGSGDTPQTEFPIGQIWLRPGFTVVNAAGSQWTGNGCTVEDGVLTGTKTAALATASQTMTGIGREGDRVLVLFGIRDKNQEVSGITVTLNNGQAQDAAAGVFEATLLAGGLLDVKLTTTWNSASLAEEGWTMEDYTVVNPDAAARQVADAEEIRDWTAYVNGLRPFTEHVEKDALYIQVLAGNWWQLSSGAEETGSYLRFADGKPVWTGKEQVLQDLGVLRMISGSYTGTGEPRTIELPVEPVLLVVAPDSGPVRPAGASNAPYDNPTVLRNGSAVTAVYSIPAGSNSVHVYATVRLSGRNLEISGGSTSRENSVRQANRKDESYTWIAVY